MKRVKILCLLIFVGLAIFGLSNNKRFAQVADASIGGPPIGVSGAPGETTCASCHFPNQEVGQFTILAPQNYTPGQTYQITVRHQTTDTTRRRWGFQLTALAGNSPVGGFANLSGNTQILTGFGRTYIEHTTAGTFQNQPGTAFWTFNWTAPATNVGAVTLYAAGNQANNDGTPEGDQIYTTTATIQPPAAMTPHRVRADFDGDGKSDVSVYRPNGGNWFINGSASGFIAAQFGNSTDKLVPADYDGDDKTDFAVWRENGAAQASFYILNSATNTFQGIGFGATGDLPANGDWDGDGRADPAVYRGGAQGAFYYLGSASGNFFGINWGAQGDLPVRGDFDGDGKADAAVFRPSDGVWYVRQSSNGDLFAVQWGIASDKRAAADYDGDSKTDVAVFRDGVWYIRQSSNGTLFGISWGLASDVPAPGDYDGDGKADVGIFRDGNWYIRLSSNGSLSAQPFGVSSDIAVPNSYLQ